MNGASQCGAYLEHLQCEHRRLNRLLIEIRREIARFRQSTQPEKLADALIDRLENLMIQLRSHFAEEDEGGCLEEALDRCRSIAPNVKVLMDEHPQLAKDLEHLIVGIKSRTMDGETCEQVFDSFAIKLKAHECAENALLQFALSGDASDYDVEGND